MCKINGMHLANYDVADFRLLETAIEWIYFLPTTDLRYFVAFFKRLRYRQTLDDFD
jgi:hypothetical protein